ncbi:MAG: FtsW/RodA/SpoVE family cell cycle protein [Huintestinicola sp.]
MIGKFMKALLGYIGQYFRRLDKMLFLAAASLSVFSVILLYSIVVNGAATIEVNSSLYKTQAIAVIAGWVIALFLSAMDYNRIIKLWVLYAPLSIILSLLVFTKLGIEVYGDRAWIDLGFMTLQPSELLKITFVTTFALHLSKVGDRINRLSNVLLLCAHAAIPTVIVILQGDDGTASVFLMIFVIMMFSAGISWKYILPCAAALPFAVYFVWTRVMKPFQKTRFLVLFDEELDPLGIGYHQRVSKTALGSGQLFGKGLFGGEYVKVPEAANDFIFTYVGQTLGFVGCMAVVAVLTYICLKIMADSRISKDDTGKYLCVGVYSMICIHCILNLGMVFGAMPVIGVPLPFLSQGGTSTLSMYIGLGLVMSAYSHSEKKYKVFYDGR